MQTFTDYNLWHDASMDPPRWCWEVVRVDDEGGEVPLFSGAEPTKAEAKARIKEATRKLGKSIEVA